MVSPVTYVLRVHTAWKDRITTHTVQTERSPTTPEPHIVITVHQGELPFLKIYLPLAILVDSISQYKTMNNKKYFANLTFGFIYLLDTTV